MTTMVGVRARTVSRTLTRADIVLGSLLVAHIVVKAALFTRLAHAPAVGDEAAYLDGGRALSNLIRDLVAFGPVDTAELQRSLVGSGWFMPGMSVLLTPLFIVDPHASVEMTRLYLGVVTTLLLVAATVSVRRVFGDVYAGALLVLPGLVPMWLLFSYAAWGDLCAGLVLVILIAELVKLLRAARRGRAPGWRTGVRIGLLAIATVYLRSSSLLVVAAIGGFTVIAACILLGRKRWLQAGTAIAAAALSFVAVLAPWSAFASSTLGGRVITTTSVPVVLANTFGDPDQLCFGPCDPGSTIWFTPLRYSREVARATGLSEVDVQQQMSAYARQGVTPHSYANDVQDNAGRYVGDPAGFAEYLRPAGASNSGFAATLVSYGTVAMFAVMVAIGSAVLLLVRRRSPDQQVVAIVVKLSLIALLTQPFVHIAGSRYWTTAAPLTAIALGLLIELVRHRRKGPIVAATRAERALIVVQAALVAAVTLTIAGIAVIAA